MKRLIEIKHDPFDIVKRIKQIDKTFKVYYQLLTGDYLLYRKSGLKNVFELNLGQSLDALAIAFILKSRRENIDLILDEIDENNHQLKQNAISSSFERGRAMLKELISFADKKSCDIDFSKENIL